MVQTLGEIFRDRHEEAVLCWGIGSGKSFLCSLALLYMAHRTLCLRDPQTHYHLAAGSTISLVNVGPTARIAEKVIFGEARELALRSPWFNDCYPADRKVRKELHFPKNVAIIPGNSSETFPLGLNVLCATMDEASFFIETLDGQREAAEDVYLALQRRVKSRFGPSGLMLLASSPRHADDFIMRKLDEAHKHPEIYASRKATWEVKPRRLFSGKTFDYQGMAVPVEYQADFRRNPQRALRDLAAIPGSSYQGFFLDIEALERACEPVQEDPVDSKCRLRNWFRPDDRAARFVHVDLGLRKDACGIAMAKAISENNLPVAVVELMLQLRAPAGGEIDFSQVRELILALRRRGFPIVQVSYDGWQSADSRQILKRQGLRTATVSVDRDLFAYDTLKELAYDGRLRIYHYEPFLRECKKLELIKGQRVDHPPGGSKDVADAVAGAVSEAVRHWRGDGVRGRIV